MRYPDDVFDFEVSSLSIILQLHASTFQIGQLEEKSSHLCRFSKLLGRDVYLLVNKWREVDGSNTAARFTSRQVPSHCLHERWRREKNWISLGCAGSHGIGQKEIATPLSLRAFPCHLVRLAVMP